MSASPHFAFVTLVTTDEYLPGALVVAAALRDLHPSPPSSANELDPRKFHVICLVTPETVSVQTLKLLRKVFDVVIGVEVIQEDTEEALELLGRPDLGTVLTKLHVFRLKSYRKIIYLDADVLPLLPLSHLFEIPSFFAAVPDVGWPDIFNSGVLVLTPGEDKFKEVMELVKSQGSWDGGDQGVLNEWRGKDWERLSFTYNTTPTAAYTYVPAYYRFGSDIKAIHFIGSEKPWSQLTFRGTFSQSTGSLADCSRTSYAHSTLLDRWFAVFDKHYRSGTAPFFSTTGSLLPGATFKEEIYQNVWDSETSDTFGGENVMGLEALRQLALEGFGQTPTRETGEGAYMTLPLEGRIDLVSLPRSRLHKFIPIKDPTMTLSRTSTDSSDSNEAHTPVDAIPESFATLTLSHQTDVRTPAVVSSAQWNPWTRTYPNTWDLVPGIQRYALHRVIAGQKAARESYKATSQKSTSRDGDDEADKEDAGGKR